MRRFLKNVDSKTDRVKPDYTISISCFSAMHAALMSKPIRSKTCSLIKNIMCLTCLSADCLITLKANKRVGLALCGHHHHLIGMQLVLVTIYSWKKYLNIPKR